MAEETSDEQGLMPTPPGTVLTHGPFCLGVMGVSLRAEPTFEEWQEVLHWVQRVEGSLQFWLGDLIEMGENRWGEKYSQALDANELQEKTLRNVAWVARQIPIDRRRMSAKVLFSHHAEVAALEPDQQEYWLQRVEAEEMTRDQLRKAIKQQRQAREGYVGDFWLLVKCADEQDQFNLADRLRNEGRTVKAPQG